MAQAGGAVASLAVATAILPGGASTAAAGSQPHTERVSISSASGQSDGNSTRPTISADGRIVAFQSWASTLVEGADGRREQIFVRDRDRGETEWISRTPDGDEPDANSGFPAVSADGRFVVFHSEASDLVEAEVTNEAYDVYVHDRDTGKTERVSVAPDGSEANGSSLAPAISADGRYVAFSSRATNLTPERPSQRSDVFVRDRETDATALVSVDDEGTIVGGSSASISDDGQRIAFHSHADSNVWVRDRETKTTYLASARPNGDKVSDTSSPSISGDGRRVAFRAWDDRLDPDVDTYNNRQAFVHDLDTGDTSQVSVASDGRTPSQGAVKSLAISGDGNVVAFQMESDLFVSGDDDDADTRQVVARNLAQEETRLVSQSTSGDPAAAAAFEPAVDGDGGVIAFASVAANLAPDVSNDAHDVYVRDASGAGLVGSCADVHVLVVRESGSEGLASDGPGGEFGRLLGGYVDELTNQAGELDLEVAALDVDYPAVSVRDGVLLGDWLTISEDSYQESRAAGTRALTQRLTDPRDPCLEGDTQYVVAGYSQGAEVTRVALWDEAARNNVDAVMLYGDPLFHYDAPGSRPIPGQRWTFGPMVGVHHPRQPDTSGDSLGYPADIEDRVVSYCANRAIGLSDPVCDWNIFWSGFLIHLDYDPAAHPDAAGQTLALLGHGDVAASTTVRPAGPATTFGTRAGSADAVERPAQPDVTVEGEEHNRSRIRVEGPSNAEGYLVQLLNTEATVEGALALPSEDDGGATFDLAGDVDLADLDLSVVTVTHDEANESETNFVESAPTVISAPAAGPGGELRTDRMAGTDRFATAVDVSRRTHHAGSPTVVVASGGDFADALAGGPLARQLDAPLLLTPAERLPDIVAAEVERLGTERAVVLGGEAAISDAVTDALDGLNVDVTRLAGADRFATAARIADELQPAEPQVVYLVNGVTGWPDAVAVAQLAADRRAAIVPVTHDSVPDGVRPALVDGIDEVVAVGGGSVIADGVLQEAGEEAAASTDRLAGAHRLATSAAVATHAGELGSTVALASGGDFADALTAGPAASRLGATLVLTPSGSIDEADATARTLRDNVHGLERALVVGGSAAINDDVVNELRRLPSD